MMEKFSNYFNRIGMMEKEERKNVKNKNIEN